MLNPLINLCYLNFMADCRPYWVADVLPYRGQTVHTSSNDPEGMRVEAEAQMQQLGLADSISLDEYSLGRAITSEVGDYRPEQAMCLALLNIKQAQRRGITVSALVMLGHGYGYGAGPDHIRGTWESSSASPTVAALLVAKLALSGNFDDFANGADDQNGPDVWVPSGTAGGPGWQKLVDDINNAAHYHHAYWVGQIPGVNPWTTIMYRTDMSIDPNGPDGQALIQAALDAYQTSKAEYNAIIDAMPICDSILDNPLFKNLLLFGMIGVGMWLFAKYV